LNNLLQALHLISAPLTLLYTNTAIVIGSVYLFLPIMITTLVDSANGLNPEIEEAAAVLGARPFTILREIILPQMAPAILTGAILVFSGAMTAYTTPQLLGGNRHLVMSTLIYQQAMTLGNWTNASVVAMVLIVLSLIVLGLLRWYTGRLDRRVDHA
jgi:putative spermidine/putrescine transport system permease protein